MLNALDLLSLAADQLSPNERAQISAALGIEKMISTIRDHTTGIFKLETPFNADPFFVLTDYIERNGKPVITSSIMSGTLADGLILVTALMGGDGMVHTIIQKSFREALELQGRAFAVLVFDAIETILDRSDEEAGPKAA